MAHFVSAGSLSKALAGAFAVASTGTEKGQRPPGRAADRPLREGCRSWARPIGDAGALYSYARDPFCPLDPSYWLDGNAAC